MRICVIKNAESEKISAVYRVVNAILEDGHECIILSRNRKRNSNGIHKKTIEINDKIVDVYEISIESEIGGGLKNIFNLTKYINTVYKRLNKNKGLYDIIHAFDLDAGLAAYRSSKLTSKPYVYHIADFYVDSRNGIPSIVEKYIRNIEFKVINNAKSTIVCTEQRIRQIQGSNPKELVVVHNAPAIEEKSNIINNIDNFIKIAYVGGLSENRFIKEMIDIVKNDKRYKLTIAGTGPLKDYVIESSERYSNIIYKGQVEYKESIEIYRDCDIIFAIYNPIIKNHRYSAPNKFYEAMMLSKAIIVARGTGVDNLVEKNNMGIIVNYCTKDVKESLDYLYDSRDSLKMYQINAHNSYPNYSYKIMSERIKKIYRYDKK